MGINLKMIILFILCVANIINFFYFFLKQGVCVAMSILLIFQIYIHIIYLNNINFKMENEVQKNKLLFFSYGLFVSGIFSFFISGGINSFILTIILFLVVNENILIVEKFPDIICYIFIISSYLILTIRANFFNFFYLIVICSNYYMYLFYEEIKIKSPYTFMIILVNIFLYINFDFFSLFLLSISILSFLSSYFMKNRKKEININIINNENINLNNNRRVNRNETENKTEKISVLNVLPLFALLIQIKAYECLEISIICFFILIDILLHSKWTKYLKQLTAYIFFGIIIKYIDLYYFGNVVYNEKGIWINIYYYLFILILNFN